MGLLEAFDHMIKNWEGPTPKDLHEAKKARVGKRPYPLADRGAKSMLLKHGKGRYVVSEVVTYSDDPQ